MKYPFCSIIYCVNAENRLGDLVTYMCDLYVCVEIRMKPIKSVL